MRKGGGGAKGAEWERQVCKDLSRFVDPDGKDVSFWRTAMSGGRATIQNRKDIINRNQVGDICCINEKGWWLSANFIVECKFYKDLDIESGLIKGKGALAGFWDGHYRLGLKHGLLPMLIARQNRTEPLVLLTREGIRKMEVFGHKQFNKPIIRAGMLTHIGGGIGIFLYNSVFK